jgi:hypothetical protein
LPPTSPKTGQTDPIVVGQIDGARGEFLVDGRNRVKACEIVGIEPAIEKRKFKNDDEVRAFVKSGGERRDITKGQRAMAHALLYRMPKRVAVARRERHRKPMGLAQRGCGRHAPFCGIHATSP